jgi:hypothetical protein
VLLTPGAAHLENPKMRMTADNLGETLDVQGLSVEDFELLDSFFSDYETAVIRTQVSSYFYEPPEEHVPKARRTDHQAPIHAGSVAEKCMKHFKTVSEMIRGGYCCDRHGRIQPIPLGARIGIPDDDVIVQPVEFCAMLKSSIGNLRDHLFLGLAFRTGARESQDRLIGVWDIDWIKKRVFVRAMKEGISFYRYLDEPFLAELAEYVKFYDLKKTDYLFCIHYHPEHAHLWTKHDYPISRETTENIFSKYAERAGIQYQYVDVHSGELRNRIHPHTSKYTFVSKGVEIDPNLLKNALTVGNKTIYPLLKTYIRIPVSERHKVARSIIAELTSPLRYAPAHHHNVLVKLIDSTYEAPEVEQ